MKPFIQSLCIHYILYIYIYTGTKLTEKFLTEKWDTGTRCENGDHANLVAFFFFLNSAFLYSDCLREFINHRILLAPQHSTGSSDWVLNFCGKDEKLVKREGLHMTLTVHPHTEKPVLMVLKCFKSCCEDIMNESKTWNQFDAFLCSLKHLMSRKFLLQINTALMSVTQVWSYSQDMVSLA